MARGRVVFRSVYTGKVYDPEIRPVHQAISVQVMDVEFGEASHAGRYTEILTMGVERLIRNPLDFARQDGVHFDLMVDVMRGHHEPQARGIHRP